MCCLVFSPRFFFFAASFAWHGCEQKFIYSVRDSITLCVRPLFHSSYKSTFSMKYIMIIHRSGATEWTDSKRKSRILDVADTCDTGSFLLEHINTQYVKILAHRDRYTRGLSENKHWQETRINDGNCVCLCHSLMMLKQQMSSNMWKNKWKNATFIFILKWC